MVNFFHRKSTIQIYELTLFEEKQDLDYIYNKMINLGHKRTHSDIKGMVTILNHFGLFESKFKEKAKYSPYPILFPHDDHWAVIYLDHDFEDRGIVVSELTYRGKSTTIPINNCKET